MEAGHQVGVRLATSCPGVDLRARWTVCSRKPDTWDVASAEATGAENVARETLLKMVVFDEQARDESCSRVPSVVPVATHSHTVPS